MDEQLNVLNSYLTFKIGDEYYAANISEILEILEIPHITKVPKASSYLKGVINLRGNVLPVIGTRSLFNIPEIENNDKSNIIVLEIMFEGQKIVTGAIVDSVHEVIELSNENILPPPSIHSNNNQNFISGMVKVDNHFIMILDINKAFSSSN